MAYDKAVDSAALDAAITYTAQRIRAKTGDTALLPWDTAKGLGDAVDAIQTGGGTAELFGVISLSTDLYVVSGVTASEDGAALILN